MLLPRQMLWCKKDQGLGLTGHICPSPTDRKWPGRLHPGTTPDAQASGGLILPQIHRLTQDSRAESFHALLEEGLGRRDRRGRWEQDALAKHGLLQPRVRAGAPRARRAASGRGESTTVCLHRLERQPAWGKVG